MAGFRQKNHPDQASEVELALAGKPSNIFLRNGSSVNSVTRKFWKKVTEFTLNI
jgi:hypothetical protein